MADKPSSWRDNFVMVAALSAAGTIGFTILVFKEIVIPTQTAQLQNEIALLKKQQGIPDDEAGGFRALRAKATQLEKDLKAIRAQLAEAQIVNMFQLGNPYPVGLAAIKVGDSPSSIEKEFSTNQIEQDEDTAAYYKSAKLKHSFFDRATFWFNRDDKKIERIVLYFARFESLTSDAERFELVRRKLVEAVGQPVESVTRRQGTTYRWLVGDVAVSLEKGTLELSRALITGSIQAPPPVPTPKSRSAPAK